MATARNVVIDYAPRRTFLPYHERTQRWACVVAHRRYGKTVGTLNDLIKRAILCQKREPRFAYIAPYYAQAKDIVWSYLRHYTSAFPDVKVSESELYVEFPHNGARIRLYGSDNYDRMRGLYLDGAVLDEPADMSPRAWPEVIRPALADRQGFATFIGTPKGKDAFYQVHKVAANDPEWFSLVLRASETGVIAKPELESARQSMTEEQYQREFEVNFDAPVPGAYYAREMMQMRAQGRLVPIPVEPSMPVYTFWDLGVDDCTAITFLQFDGREVRVCDALEGKDEGLAYYVDQLRQRSQTMGYKYGGHFFPHDGNKRDFQSGVTTIEAARKMGMIAELIPITGLGAGIEAARKLIPRCVFDARRAQGLVAALEAYTKEYIEERGVYREKPLHNWASHFADSFRYAAVALEMNLVRDKAIDSMARPVRRSEVVEDGNYDPLGRDVPQRRRGSEFVTF